MGDHAQHLAFKEERIAKLRSTLEAAFAPGTSIHLELGCGHGHWLTAFAENHSEKACLGVDLITHRIRKAEAKKGKRALRNLHFLKAEASELLAAWPADRPLADVFMLFPDPWPKARHHKNRMVQREFLDKMAELMPAGGHFFFRTDHADYFDWTRDRLSAHHQWKIVPDKAWPWETETYFQGMMDSWQSIVAERRA